MCIRDRCETIETCEAATSVIVAPARSAILRCAEDRIIPPGTQRGMAERAGATISEVSASHVSMVSHPDVSVAAILAAVAGVG